MKSQEKVESSAAIAEAIGSLPGSRTPAERAEKKAARRAAFIQTVAEAIVIKPAHPHLVPTRHSGLLYR